MDRVSAKVLQSPNSDFRRCVEMEEGLGHYYSFLRGCEHERGDRACLPSLQLTSLVLAETCVVRRPVLRLAEPIRRAEAEVDLSSAILAHVE